MLVFATIATVQEWRRHNALQATHDLYGYIREAAIFIDEFQLERGLSAGFQSSKGRKFREELSAQRPRVDRQVQQLKDLLATPQFAAMHRQTRNYLASVHDDLVQRLSLLAAIRRDVDTGQNDNAYFRYFTEINTRMLLSFNGVADELAEASLSPYIESLNALLWLQEYAGQERAIVNAALAAGKFTLQDLRLTEGIIARQQLHETLFRNVIGAGVFINDFDTAMADPAIAQVYALRAATGGTKGYAMALGVAPADNILSRNPEQWFETTTRRIDAINKISRNIWQALDRQLTELVDNAYWHAQIITWSALASLVFCLYASRHVSKRLFVGISKITDTIENMAEKGHLETPLHDADDDEIGIMVRSLKKLSAAHESTDTAASIKQFDLAAEALKADESNKAKTEFLARMNHELRTPLNAILGYAQLLQSENGLTDEQAHEIGAILRAGEHLLALINEILDLARIEAGRIAFNKETVALQYILDTCLELVTPAAARKQINISCDIDPQNEILFYTDATRLKEVLLNLLSNAVKYNRDGGSVRIGGESTGNGNFRVSIADSGAGLTADSIARLFKPFERLAAQYSDVEGTGMGLVITKRIVEEMGGAIGVESVPGKGSTFWLELPVMPA